MAKKKDAFGDLSEGDKFTLKGRKTKWVRIREFYDYEKMVSYNAVSQSLRLRFFQSFEKVTRVQ